MSLQDLCAWGENPPSCEEHFDMNCVKVLNSFKKNFTRSISIRKCSEVVNVPLAKGKVKLFVTTYNMEDLYDPPKHLKGMKVLDRDAFKKTILVSCLTVETSILNDVAKLVKIYLLKIMALKPIKEAGDKQQILIDPKKVNVWNDFDADTQKKLLKLNISECNLSKVSVDLEYKNWGARDLLQTILPGNEQILKSYSIIGHIIHLNIKDNLLEYKNVIAEILLDKVSFAKTVVYKKNFINSVYRNFEMEVLCGEHNFIASVKMNQCNFELDFSKVYWNPRLGTEHQRIVDLLEENDVLFDVFAGIGPFAIPAAKKKCLVFANDLNPESIKWLEHNITLNKKAIGFITSFNKDGKDFILQDVKENLIKIYEKDDFEGSIHVVMNLPLIAPTFMKYFNNLLNKSDLVNVDIKKIKKCLPIIQCYFFVKGEVNGKGVFEQEAGMSLNDVEHSVHFVRKVSGSGSMFRISFTLPFAYLVAENGVNEGDEPLPKRICT